MIAASFLTFLLIFLLIGVLSAFKSRKTTEDYLIASKAVPPWLAGLSAIATNNSGYMFIGMIGVTYAIGLSSVWLMIGWVLGDLMISFLTFYPIRKVSEKESIHSYGGLLARWQGGDFRKLRRLSGFLTVIFLSLYAAAQLKAGSKAASVFLHWDPAAGILVAAAIVLVYSVAGGIRASIWTDAAQSVVMLVGMTLLVFVGVQEAGGVQSALQTLNQVSPTYMGWFPDKNIFEVVLFIVGWLFGGVAVIGQPHIVIRFMSVDDKSNVNKMRFYYYTWFTFFYGATILVGLLSRAVLTDPGRFDAELALPLMASDLLPDVLMGLIMAALFAATLSTADSLVLSCSAAITRDFFQGKEHSLRMAKFATFLVLAAATLIAIYGEKSVFRLVLDAWGLLASAFAPLIIVYCLKRYVSEKRGIAMMAVGVLAFIVWEQTGLGQTIYSVAPGITAGLLVSPLVK